eukprot:CAMPEP_0194445332 /NCGR_PEP_ID=MMETSP0176-20130528/127802_1 /TAXON_ID=216777 /ORGANISM="Proboscia alata, Strain PI-D3" /LENGTH=434 /DNA_ID=CAMNT_0039271873 /DNA_START=297 /DNA_END=1601 /DNA_ORIENTATION=-
MTSREAITVNLMKGKVRGSVRAISQLVPPVTRSAPNHDSGSPPMLIGYTIVVYCVALGAIFGMLFALICNKNLNSTILSFFFHRDLQPRGIPLNVLTYGAVDDNLGFDDSFQRAMKTRCVTNPTFLTLIDPGEIILHRIIGEGTFGRVWSANWGSSSVAVKEFVFAQAAVVGKSMMRQQIIEEIIGEAGMMAMLRHPQVLQLFGCCLTSQAIWIVSELCSLGSLRQLLDDKEKDLSIQLRLRLALHVAEGMMYMHAQNPPILHRDLKSHNIFVHETSSGSTDTSEKAGLMMDGNSYSENSCERHIVAKIGDWGSARAALAGSRTMTHGVGTACWLAPEVIKFARSSKKSDVYGFGIILWELATREEVYKGLQSTQIIARVANDNLRPSVPEDCLWKHLMMDCWHENPMQRVTFDVVVVELNTILSQVTIKSDFD